MSNAKEVQKKHILDLEAYLVGEADARPSPPDGWHWLTQDDCANPPERGICNPCGDEKLHLVIALSNLGDYNHPSLGLYMVVDGDKDDPQRLTGNLSYLLEMAKVMQSNTHLTPLVITQKIEQAIKRIDDKKTL